MVMDAAEPQTSLPAASPQHRSEPALRAAIAQTLRAHGLAVDEQVTCAAGAADLVTARRDAIWEVKLALNRRALQQALGQLFLYRATINPEARMIVVGYPTPETAVLRPHIEALGIEVVELGPGAWELGDRVQGLGVGEAVQPPSPNPQPPLLRWRLAEYAQFHGILSVRALSFATRTSRQSLHPIWQGRAKSISLDMLGRLCQTLVADPGGWFSWHRDELIWNVRHVAEIRNMTLRDLVWLAEILPHSLTPIWQGLQQFVSVETLAKLAQALDLDTGELFEWREMRTERPGLSDEDERGLSDED
jgi:DNA-binding Xre family transcriptional regulator